MAELLLELLSEEIPAAMQDRAAADLKRLVCDQLKAAGLSYDGAEAYATPRRLTLVVDGLPVRQPDIRAERKGPRTDAPEQAVAGFLKSVGLSRDQIETRDTPKGAVLYAVIEQVGAPTGTVLGDFLPAVLGALPWPKSMRWGRGEGRWVRPLHGVLGIFDGAVIPFSFIGIEAGDTTQGHRFMAPADFSVRDFADYRDTLRAAYVMVDSAERRAVIAEGAALAARGEGLALKPDAGLIAEIAGLVEWPVVLTGTIDAAYMSLPGEVLTTSMGRHLKYLALIDGDGNPAPRFVVIANIQAVDGGGQIVAGNERVLRARLADAQFFWDQDSKRDLESRIPDLNVLVFHAELGSVGDKVTRIEAQAVEIAASIEGADEADVREAARLCKTDLVSGMVGEFPELQGIMGGYYAAAEGKSAAVFNAIAEHYAPRGPNDTCPTAPVSVAVALADKIDSLVYFWGIGEKPTGSKDPFALRRAALGVIRLIVENNLRLPLYPLFGDNQNNAEDLLGFFADRLKVHLKARGVRHDLIAAVFALGEDDLVRLLARVEALRGFLAGADGEHLLIAYRRAANMLRIEEKKDGVGYDGGAIDQGLLREADEQALAEGLSEISEIADAALRREDFVGAVSALARLRTPVDGFFDRVTVNCDDADLRRNRLGLLGGIRATLDRVADFSKIEG